jgi:hypothetical protein
VLRRGRPRLADPGGRPPEREASRQGPAARRPVRSSDGYTTLFALAEFGDAFSSRTLLVADSVDGAPIAGKFGPLRLIAPGDKRAGRWARMVSSIEIVQPGAAVAKAQP